MTGTRSAPFPARSSSTCRPGSTPNAKRLVIENAHLTPRTPQSAAQVFEQSELEALHRSASGIELAIRSFPNRLTQRTRREGRHPTAGCSYEDLATVGIGPKSCDTMAIHDFVLARPEVPLKKWRPLTARDETFHAAMNEIRDEMTSRLNAMRPGYPMDNPDVADAYRRLSGFVASLSADEQRQFGITFFLRGANRGRINPRTVKWSQIMAIYVAVFDYNQDLREHKGRFVGVKFIWEHLLLLSAHSGASGTARSNLMYHGLRNFDKRLMSGDQYTYRDSPATHRRRRGVWAEWRKGIKTLIKAFRDAP